MHVRFQDTAEDDLDSIAAYVGPRSPLGLAKVMTSIFTIASQLEHFPLMGRPGQIDGTRELIVPRTPYRLIYVVDEPYYIDVIRVLHGKRKYPPDA